MNWHSGQLVNRSDRLVEEIGALISALAKICRTLANVIS